MSRERMKLADDLTALTGGVLPEIEFEHLLSYVFDLVYPDQVKGLRVDWDLLPAFVRKNLREAMNDEQQLFENELEEYCRAEVSEMSPRDVLEKFLHYEGIVNYTGTILMAWSGICAASKTR